MQALNKSAVGFAASFPIKSGAVPCILSNRAQSCPIFPEGVRPRPPTNPLPRSLRISPYRFGITSTVLLNCFGFETKPRQIQSLNGNYYGVSGYTKRDDGKGYSTEGGKEVIGSDIKLADI